MSTRICFHVNPVTFRAFIRRYNERETSAEKFCAGRLYDKLAKYRGNNITSMIRFMRLALKALEGVDAEQPGAAHMKSTQLSRM